MDFKYANAKLVRIVDGDTAKIRVDCGFHTHVEETFRLAGINCPEMNTAEGLKAKLFAESWFTRHAGECSLVCHGQEKFGRWLATIASTTDANDTLNGALLANGLAKEYR